MVAVSFDAVKIERRTWAGTCSRIKFHGVEDYICIVYIDDEMRAVNIHDHMITYIWILQDLFSLHDLTSLRRLNFKPCLLTFIYYYYYRRIIQTTFSFKAAILYKKNHHPHSHNDMPRNNLDNKTGWQFCKYSN